MTVPSIGPIISSAMVAAIGNGEVCSKGRDFAAWLGLVPRQLSTGDRANSTRGWRARKSTSTGAIVHGIPPLPVWLAMYKQDDAEPGRGPISLLSFLEAENV